MLKLLNYFVKQPNFYDTVKNTEWLLFFSNKSRLILNFFLWKILSSKARGIKTYIWHWTRNCKKKSHIYKLAEILLTKIDFFVKLAPFLLVYETASCVTTFFIVSENVSQFREIVSYMVLDTVYRVRSIPLVTVWTRFLLPSLLCSLSWRKKLVSHIKLVIC